MQEKIISLIREKLPTDFLEVKVDGNHCTLTVVSAQFEGLTPVKKQQLVYACLGEQIESGEIHAVNIRAYTPGQWQAQHSSS